MSEFIIDRLTGNATSNSKGEIMTTIAFDKVEWSTPKSILFVFDREKIWLPSAEIYVQRDKNKVSIPHWLYKFKFPKG